jgi:hypothetical protein
MAIDIETYRKLSKQELRKLPREEFSEIRRIAARYHEGGHAASPTATRSRSRA